MLQLVWRFLHVKFLVFIIFYFFLISTLVVIVCPVPQCPNTLNVGIVYFLALFFSQQWNSGPGALAIPPSMYNPLDEPSPLGLRLRKSPSLLDLIQMKLSQQNSSKLANVDKKDHKGTNDKLKASNFPGSILKIGTWEVYLHSFLDSIEIETLT